MVPFFVLSGYLITTLLVREHEASGGIDLRKFFVRRGARLLPALIVVIAVSGPLVAYVAGAGHLIGAASTLFYSTNLVAAFMGEDAVGHFSWGWTLALEEQFYLVWPIVLILFLARNRSLVPWLIAILVICGALRAILPMDGDPPAQLYFSPWARGDALAAGCIIAFVATTLRRRDVLGSAVTAISSVTLGLCLFAAEWTGRTTFVVYLPISILASMGVLIGLLWSPQSIVARLLSLWPLAYVGRLSYGIYLWNVPVLVLVWALPLSTVLSVALWVGATALLSVLSYHFLEIPAQRAINSAFTSRPQAEKPATSGAPLADSPHGGHHPADMSEAKASSA